MATFNSLFPTFLSKCADLHTLLLSVAFALFVTGIIVTVHHGCTRKAMLNLLLRIMVLTALLVFLPQWGNTMQSLLQNAVLSGLGVDPGEVHNQYVQLLETRASDRVDDPDASDTPWWNVFGRIRAVTIEVFITVLLWAVGCVASFLIWWAYIFQKIILNLGYALSPILIGFMALPALRHIGTRYLLNLVGVLLWPLGWAVAALVTQGLLDFMTDQSFLITGERAKYAFQNLIGLNVLAFWIIFSTFAAPLIIQRVITSGMLPGGELLAGATRAAIQTAQATTGGIAGTAHRGALVAAAAGGTAGVLTLMSAASQTGHAGAIINTAAGVSLRPQKDDLSGDHAARRALAQLRDHLGELRPITPKA